MFRISSREVEKILLVQRLFCACTAKKTTYLHKYIYIICLFIYFISFICLFIYLFIYLLIYLSYLFIYLIIHSFIINSFISLYVAKIAYCQQQHCAGKASTHLLIFHLVRSESYWFSRCWSPCISIFKSYLIIQNKSPKSNLLQHTAKQTTT